MDYRRSRPALLVARMLVTPASKSVPVRLLNLRTNIVKVQRGTVVAQMESVEMNNPVFGTAQLAGSILEPKTQLMESLTNQLGITNHVSGAQRQQLIELLIDFADIFSVAPDDLGHTSKLQHHIDTGNPCPVKQPIRRIPPAKRKETQKLLQEMLKKDIIQPSSSPWASPIVLVQKKDGSQQFCIDYRKLNSVIKKMLIRFPVLMTRWTL